MKRVSTFSLAFGLAMGAATTFAIAPAAAQETAPVQEQFNSGNISEAVRSPVAAAQAALQPDGTFDAATVRGQLEAAKGAIVNDDDRFIVGQLMLQLGVRMQRDGADAAEVTRIQGEGLRLALDSNRLATTERGRYWTFLGNMAKAAGNSAEAVTAYQNALSYDPNNGDALINVADAQFHAGDNAAGFVSADRAIAAARAGGEVPPTWLSVPLNAAIMARDNARVFEYGRQLIELTPRADIWSQVLLAYSSSARFDDQANLDMFRLLGAVNALESDTYREYAELAMRRGLPGEVQAVVDAARAAGVTVTSEDLSDLEGRLASDRRSLAQERTNAQSADGVTALNTADAFAAYGEYDAALELYRLARQKGGVDIGTVDLRTARTLIAAGRAAEARPLLEGVTGSREGLAKFWLVWLNQQAGAQPAVAADTAPEADVNADTDAETTGE